MIINRINRFFEVIGGVLLCFMTAIIILQSFSRYVFNYAMPWPEEVGRIAFIWSTYIAIALTIRNKSHLRVEILPLMLRGKAKQALLVFTEIMNTAFYILLVLIGTDMAIKVFNMNQFFIAIPVPVWTIWVGIIIFSILAVLNSAKNLYEAFCPTTEATI